jgi:hypothetical protein
MDVRAICRTFRPAQFTVTVAAGEEEPWKVASPANTAFTGAVEVNALVVNKATPLDRVAVPIVTPFEANVIVPVGEAVPDEGITEALSVIDVPLDTCRAELPTLVAVAMSGEATVAETCEEVDSALTVSPP